MMDASARHEVSTIFPELTTRIEQERIACIHGATARDFVHKREISGVHGVSSGVRDRTTSREQNGLYLMQWAEELRC